MYRFQILTLFPITEKFMLKSAFPTNAYCEITFDDTG